LGLVEESALTEKTDQVSPRMDVIRIESEDAAGQGDGLGIVALQRGRLGTVVVGRGELGSGLDQWSRQPARLLVLAACQGHLHLLVLGGQLHVVGSAQAYLGEV